MKHLLSFMIVLFTLPSFADHTHLTAVAQMLRQDSYQLQQGCRQAIGAYPKPHQKYAFEHIQYFANSAWRFELAISQGSHYQIYGAYQQLQHDGYYARSTFEDLFWPFRDHQLHDRLDRLLRQCENEVQEIGWNLP